MPKPYPKEFRQDVVRVARNREPGQTLKQIAADFGISESCLAGWITQPVPIPASRPTTSAEHRRPKGRTRDGVSSSYWHTTVKHLPGQDIVTMTPPLQLSLLAQGRPAAAACGGRPRPATPRCPPPTGVTLHARWYDERLVPRSVVPAEAYWELPLSRNWGGLRIARPGNQVPASVPAPERWPRRGRHPQTPSWASSRPDRIALTNAS